MIIDGLDVYFVHGVLTSGKKKMNPVHLEDRNFNYCGDIEISLVDLTGFNDEEISEIVNQFIELGGLPPMCSDIVSSVSNGQGYPVKSWISMNQLFVGFKTSEVDKK